MNIRPQHFGACFTCNALHSGWSPYPRYPARPAPPAAARLVAHQMVKETPVLQSELSVRMAWKTPTFRICKHEAARGIVSQITLDCIQASVYQSARGGDFVNLESGRDFFPGNRHTRASGPRRARRTSVARRRSVSTHGSSVVLPVSSHIDRRPTSTSMLLKSNAPSCPCFRYGCRMRSRADAVRASSRDHG